MTTRYFVLPNSAPCIAWTGCPEGEAIRLKMLGWVETDKSAWEVHVKVHGNTPAGRAQETT